MSTPKNAMEVREKFEECGHSFSLFVELCTSDITLNKRSKLALFEYGKSRMQAYENAESLLRAQGEEATDLPVSMLRTG
ncbi:hypothetical protein F638_1020 [Pseudomonas sp. LAIL14HWK12:I2]|jgi:hypothetical protein|uniref:hypothetical protein n=1 Tax=unclassified Pseudomonas TaxID=196821 RepID=UPI001068BEE4|nr:hypothetical protein [Pseudomonas sp. LAIL14HWK12:I2]TFA86105.1 hypothetical protein F638_1020 [Pseudomonas sp. LAIL14HWK12:I2]